jgi:hypothetical protein
MLRVVDVLRIRLDGAKLWDVTEYVTEAEQADGSPWQLADGQTPLTKRQVARYVEKADAIIAESTRESRKRSIAKHLAQRANLYAKAVNAGDVRSALAVLRDEAELRGLYPPSRTQLTGKDGAPLIPPPPIQVSEIIITSRDQADAVLAKLAAESGVPRQ